MRIAVAPLGLLCALLLGCGADPPDTEVRPRTTTAEPSIPVEETPEYIRSNEPCNRPADIGIRTAGPSELPPFRLEPVVIADQPTVVTFTPDGTMLIGSRIGVVSRWDGDGPPEVVLDLSDETAAENDQGLLGLTVSPGGDWLYVNRTDGSGDSLVSAFALDGAEIDDRERQIMRVDQPSRLHNGGDLAFAPDGTLYVSFGDGGGLGDRFGNAQDLSTPLGAVLRISPRPGADPPFVVPADNPFVDDDTIDPRIWAYGIRNPLRFSFDDDTGTLWLADLGQQCREEINALRTDEAGANLGWNVWEADGAFLGELAEGRVHRAPDFSYWHTPRWCAVVGGHVYRGTAIDGLVGSYVFSDFCGGGVVVAAADRSELVAYPAELERPVDITADPSGELHLVTMGGTIFRLDPPS